jgi:hypothetical protein
MGKATKDVIRSRNSVKNRWYHCQEKKNKKTNNDLQNNTRISQHFFLKWAYLMNVCVPDECLCTWWMFLYLMNVFVPDECFCTWWMFLYLMNVFVPDECFCTWWMFVYLMNVFVPDECFSRNASYALSWISTLLLCTVHQSSS